MEVSNSQACTYHFVYRSLPCVQYLSGRLTASSALRGHHDFLVLHFPQCLTRSVYRSVFSMSLTWWVSFLAADCSVGGLLKCGFRGLVDHSHSVDRIDLRCRDRGQ